jgi:hypothetical protein
LLYWYKSARYSVYLIYWYKSGSLWLTVVGVRSIALEVVSAVSVLARLFPKHLHTHTLNTPLTHP